jgi:hypothetical protein
MCNAGAAGAVFPMSGTTTSDLVIEVLDENDMIFEPGDLVFVLPSTHARNESSFSLPAQISRIDTHEVLLYVAEATPEFSLVVWCNRLVWVFTYSLCNFPMQSITVS